MMGTAVQAAVETEDETRTDSAARGIPAGGALVALLACVLVAIGVGVRLGLAPAILVLAAGALLAVIGLTFRALQAIAESDDDEGVAHHAPTMAEDQKRAALQALKDLEYERGVGNITDADYAELVARYRAEAKRHMRVVDDQRKQLRSVAEALAQQTVRTALGGEPKSRADVRDDRVEKPARASSDRRSTLCADCNAANDDDARFCKRCGKPLDQPSPPTRGTDG